MYLFKFKNIHKFIIKLYQKQRGRDQLIIAFLNYCLSLWITFIKVSKILSRLIQRDLRAKTLVVHEYLWSCGANAKLKSSLSLAKSVQQD